MANVTWRARLRFRLQKKLAINASDHRIQVAGREVVLSPPTPDLNIADSSWLILNARGFSSEGEARDFGRKLKSAVQVSAVAARVGVDTGQDLATSSLGQSLRDEVFKQTGSDMRPDVHGLDVFPDEPNTASSR